MPSTTAVYTNLPGTIGGPLSLRRAGQSRFVLPDLQGHARQLTDSAGVVTDTLTTDAWGVPKATSGSTVNPYRSFGQWGYFTDTPSRLYVRARHLRVDIGRWVSRDPRAIGSEKQCLYCYVQGNPVSTVDPTGWKCGDPQCISNGKQYGLDESSGCWCGKCCQYDCATAANYAIYHSQIYAALSSCYGANERKSLNRLATVLTCLAKAESSFDPNCNDAPPNHGLFQLDETRAFNCGPGGPTRVWCDEDFQIAGAIGLIHWFCNDGKNVLAAFRQYWGPTMEDPPAGNQAGRKTWLACLKANNITEGNIANIVCPHGSGCPKCWRNPRSKPRMPW